LHGTETVAGVLALNSFDGGDDGEKTEDRNGRAPGGAWPQTRKEYEAKHSFESCRRISDGAIVDPRPMRNLGVSSFKPELQERRREQQNGQCALCKMPCMRVCGPSRHRRQIRVMYGGKPFGGVAQAKTIRVLLIYFRWKLLKEA
jgi:hypothetical protein